MTFATPADLEARLGVTFDATETIQAAVLLDDATAYLQAEIGQLIEAGTATYTTRWRGGPIRLPQSPVTQVDEVQLDASVTTDWDFVDQELHLGASHVADVTVTFDYGYAAAPTELKGWTCVLASQLMGSTVGGSLGMAGVRSETIDDYSVTYVVDGSNMTLPANVLDRLRARYGQGAYVTGVGRS